MTAITADFFRGGASPSISPGSGSVSEKVESYFAETKTLALAAASTLQSRAAAVLARLQKECSVKGWDGYEARPITSRTIARAQVFIDGLPCWMPSPEIVPESDGEIAIEWDLGPNEIFSISIGELTPIHFAGLFGKNKERHGVEPFESSIPEEILSYINKLLRIPATRRAA